MATATITFPAGSSAGAALRALAASIQALAANVPDSTAGGASVTLVIDDAPGGGDSYNVTLGGPYLSRDGRNNRKGRG